MNNSPAIAVIDIGSNTFHLVIVDSISSAVVYKQRIFVSLAEEGIHHIGSAAYDRGIHAMEQFSAKLDAHKVIKTRAVGTAALRSASNAQDFIKDVEKLTGIQIKVISGQEEAKYIYGGITSILPLMDNDHLIMDIGGGSVEYILVNNRNLDLVRSYNIGLGELHNSMAHSHPISKSAYQSIRQHIEHTIADIKVAVANRNILSLIGASGSFEVLAALTGHDITTGQYCMIDQKTAYNAIQEIYSMDMDSIKQNDNIPSSRAKLIVLAMILIEVSLDISNAKEVCLSPAAMKEGILAEMLS